MTEDVIKEGMDRIRGRLLGLIESFGLPERQERACVSTVKGLSYDLQKEILESLRSSSPSQ